MNTERITNAKRAFQKSLLNLPSKLDKIWESENGKPFIKHLVLAFLPKTKREVYPIGIFSNHKKYNNIPKVCSLTNFAVTDVDFRLDEITIQHFSKMKKNITKISFSIPCVGSTKSNSILSREALSVFHSWANEKDDETINSLLKTSNGKKVKNTETYIEKMATYTLADKFDFSKIKNKLK